jgi:5-methylcytosine-specific restriction endonuclease McrA
MADSDSNHVIISRKEAKARGLKHYFTGKPCKRGHIALRLTSAEMCTVCESNAHAIRHQEKRVDELKRMRERYYSNRARELEYARLYYVKNREILIEKSRKFRKDNPSLAREVNRRSWEKHRIQYLELTKRWYAEHKDAKRVYHARRKARKFNNGGSHTPEDIADIRKLQRGKCAICRTDLSDKYDVDHIVPLARGGSNSRRNLQILCESCNTRKHARDPIDHMRSLGMLL